MKLRHPLRCTMARLASVLLFLGLVQSPSQFLRASPRESLERRLLRTIQIGLPQDITVVEIKKIAAGADTPYLNAILARSALVVLQQDKDSSLVPYSELFDSALNNLAPNTNAYPSIPALPDFRGKETVFTMVYAMVMSGNQERVTDWLEQHLFTGSKYKQAVVLSALRNIGTPRAVGLIQKYVEKGQDSNLAQNTIADEDYPILVELYDRWGMVPPAERTRENLRRIMQGGCNQHTAMASYWLGFFPSNLDPNAEEAEIQAFEKIMETNSPTCEMMEHIIALKALALRAPKTIAYWTRLARKTTNVWERHQIVLNAWSRFGRKFAPTALELLKDEPAQYIQWELLNGNVETRQGYVYRDYWDIWMPLNILAIMEFPVPQLHAVKHEMPDDDVNAMLAWLEAGARPKDPWVWNHTLYNLAGLVSGDNTRRWLRLFNAHPKRNENWWIAANLRDPSALPIVEYWATLPGPKDQTETLRGLVGNLQNRRDTRSVSAKPCCQPTEACLLEHLQRPAGAAMVTIHSEQEAREWLAQSPAPAAEFKIRYTDELKRAAVVTSKSGAEQHWEYLYDCWRDTDSPSKADPPK